MSALSSVNGDLFGERSLMPMPIAEVPGALPNMAPTGSEIRMATAFPDDSELLHEWLGTAGGHIKFGPVDGGFLDPTDPRCRQGSVVDGNGTVSMQFEFRATPPGRLSKGFFAALGGLAGKRMQPRGMISGRIIPSRTEA